MVVKKDSTIRPTPPPAPARSRILETATRLFYDEGVHTVGVDRVIAESKVTKATFYKHWGSKEALVVAYLASWDQRIRGHLDRLDAEYSDPQERIRALLRDIGAEITAGDFSGCPFINATAQFSDPSHAVRTAVETHRRWYAERVEELFREAGHPRPSEAAADYFLTRDGAFASANLGDPCASESAVDRATGHLLADLPAVTPRHGRSPRPRRG